ncbi:oxidoreductase [Prauserella cavernicola]|uniref:Oxidoreductase n=1 Tax=Prauserella cavernicola TaxID=2800127 RepID=A0A934QQU5_9PSEU|nr:oxidoreductase [Prauserella cavernicola]MBK1784695.1 oxidoreductase [Prauserella cavernicola]
MPGFRRGGRESGEGEDGQVEAVEQERPPFDPFAPHPDRQYELKAADLLRPFTEPGGVGLRRWRRQATNAPIVQVEDAYITGKLDLRAADLQYLFRFERCRFEEPPDVREANLLGLVFRKCWLPGLKARNLRSRNDVRLIRCLVEVDSGSSDAETTVRRAEDFERGLPDAAVNLTDAVIEGSVVLTRTRIYHPRGKAIQADRLVITGALLAYRIEASGEVRLPGMRAGGNVNFSGATLDNPDGFALNGNGMQVGGSLLCEVDNFGRRTDRRRFTANGMLFMPSVKVSGDIVLRGGRLVVDQTGDIVVDAWKTGDWYVDPRPALIADRLHVEGNIELSDQLDVTGTIRMVNARLGGSLRLAGARIKVLRGQTPPFHDRAVHLDGTEINGDIDGKGMWAEGQLRLADVKVRGNVLIAGATFFHPERDVVSARRSTVSGNLLLTDCAVTGTLRLQGMNVGGSIDLRGTDAAQPEITDAGSWSVDLRAVQVARSLLLMANRDRPFRAKGGVTMDGAVVKRQIDFTGAELYSMPRDGIALDAGDTTADEFVLAPIVAPEGTVVLRRAHCGTLSDTPALWKATGGLELEDFRYDALDTPIDLRDDKTVKGRLEQLHDAMPGYRPGPYDQLATMLRTSGNEEHADTVLLKKQQYRYESLAKGNRVLGLGVRLWSWLQRSMVGYGYRPVRALAWLVMLLVAGSLWFGVREDDCVLDTERFEVVGERCAVNRDDSGLEWNPVLYTADLLVPIVDFGNKGRWFMADEDKWVSTGFTAMGWVLATTVAAGVTRTLRRNGS